MHITFYNNEYGIHHNTNITNKHSQPVIDIYKKENNSVGCEFFEEDNVIKVYYYMYHSTPPEVGKRNIEEMEELYNKLLDYKFLFYKLGLESEDNKIFQTFETNLNAELHISEITEMCDILYKLINKPNTTINKNCYFHKFEKGIEEGEPINLPPLFYTPGKDELVITVNGDVISPLHYKEINSSIISFDFYVLPKDELYVWKK